jgi:hypothetical protein
VTGPDTAGRLPAKSAATATITAAMTRQVHSRPSYTATISAGQQQRRDAALRTAPLSCGHRDPLLCGTTHDQPSAFSLTRRELITEIRRCHQAGWQRWELAARFAALPGKAVTA